MCAVPRALQVDATAPIRCNSYSKAIDATNGGQSLRCTWNGEKTGPPGAEKTNRQGKWRGHVQTPTHRQACTPARAHTHRGLRCARGGVSVSSSGTVEPCSTERCKMATNAMYLIRFLLRASCQSRPVIKEPRRTAELVLRWSALPEPTRSAFVGINGCYLSRVGAMDRRSNAIRNADAARVSMATRPRGQEAPSLAAEASHATKTQGSAKSAAKTAATRRARLRQTTLLPAHPLCRIRAPFPQRTMRGSCSDWRSRSYIHAPVSSALATRLPPNSPQNPTFALRAEYRGLPITRPAEHAPRFAW